MSSKLLCIVLVVFLAIEVVVLVFVVLVAISRVVVLVHGSLTEGAVDTPFALLAVLGVHRELVEVLASASRRVVQRSQSRLAVSCGGSGSTSG